MTVKKTARRIHPHAAILALCLLPAALAGAQISLVNSTDDGIAIKGYDPVAYFTVGAAVEGSEEYSLQWGGAEWRFANANHLELFQADPERYAPQYGGYCAWAAAKGYIADIDPEAFTVYNEDLYLNFSKSIKRRWERDKDGNIAAADANWPGIAESAPQDGR
jgi:YHS domain-containing protein